MVSMVQLPRLVWALVAAAALAVVAPATATTAVLLSREQLVKKSNLVVRATVGEAVSAWNAEETAIVTHTKLNVRGYLKGKGSSELWLEQYGGTVGDKTMVVSGDAQLRQGQEVVLFLKQAEGGYVHLTALSQAAYSLKDGKVRRDMTGMTLYRPVNGKLVPVKTLAEPAETLTHLTADVARLSRTP